MNLPASLAAGGAALALAPVAFAAGGPTVTQIAGNPLPEFPHFHHVRAFNEGSTLHAGVDASLYPQVAGQTADLYVVAAKTPSEWTSDPSLVDLTGSIETVTFTSNGITANTFVIDSGTLSSNAGIELGVGYDVVIDVDQDGQLGPADLIDGYSDTEAGMYVVHDTTQPGPLTPVEVLYSFGGSFESQNTFYPSNVASLGELPLVVVSHGNGHNYQWYDHIGNHLASYGYIVMSHQNNTGPGVEFAATTTLTNTDLFLNNLPSIAGGILDGHVDDDRIVWIGHSRGGEGICIAYDRLFDGTFTPTSTYTIEDIQLLSSIAPTDFQGWNNTHPHDVNYHLWTGAADSDVNGCASCNLCQTFHLHDRAEQFRQSTSLYGVGHAWFHNGGGFAWASGPCLVGEADTHKIELGYLLPLVERYVDGNLPAEDFLWRQYESFHPIGAPVSTNPCVTVDLMYREGVSDGKIVIDDFQTNPSLDVASIGVPVTRTVSNVTEGDLDDANSTFTHTTTDPMNGMTVNGIGLDDSKGVVFEWSGSDVHYGWIAPGPVPLSLWDAISFRVCQATRHPLTTAVQEDLSFSVTLIDEDLTTVSIPIDVYGGGVEEPYQRTSCGTGAGWANEFETIRVPIEAFAHERTGIKLNRILAVGFQFGPSYGSSQGRIGLDDVELVHD